MKTENGARPAPKKLALTKETLRKLTAPELRLAAGGRPKPRTFECTR